MRVCGVTENFRNLPSHKDLKMKKNHEYPAPRLKLKVSTSLLLMTVATLAIAECNIDFPDRKSIDVCEYKTDTLRQSTPKATIGDVTGTVIYICSFKALHDYKTSELFTIWSTRSKGRYLVENSGSQANPREAFLVKGFGTPTKGDFSITFRDGVRVTVTSNGWGTTSLDHIANKNSLYGATSNEPSKAGGSCKRAGNITAQFIVTE